MRIAIDARFYGHENGGLGRYTINLLTELSNIDKKNEYFILVRKSYFGKLNLPSNFHEVLVEARHYSFYEQILVPLTLFRIQPDLTHFLHFNAPLLFKGKFVITIHDLLMHNGVGKAATTLILPLYLLKRLFYRFVFDGAITEAKSILVPSEFVKSEILKNYTVSKNKIIVTYEGVDSKIKKIKLRSSLVPYFLYVGNAYPHKNLRKAIEAIVYLNKVEKTKAIITIITPKNIFEERLQELIEELDAKEFVQVIGKVSDEKLSEYYSNATAFIYPSISEGFGLPALEAMSVGTPAIVSDIPIFREVYKNNAIYFDQTDPASIAEKMKEVLNMKKSSKAKLSEQLQKFVNNYSWLKTARATLAVYENS